MDQQTHELLLLNDVENWEFPADFNYSECLDAVCTVWPRLEAALGLPLSLDDQIQDASYFAELTSFADKSVLPNGVAFLRHRISIPFSNFGRLVTIGSGLGPSGLEAYPIQRLIEVLTEHGFQYVAPEALAELYDGRVEMLRNKRTWCSRYFDYL